MVTVNLIAIAAATVVAYIIGAVWYSVLFKKQWMMITGFAGRTKEEQQKAAQEAGPLYFIQLVITAIEAYILGCFINKLPDESALMIGLWVFVGFALPTVMGAVMWSGVRKEVIWKQISIQVANQFVTVLAMAWILGMWR